MAAAGVAPATNGHAENVPVATPSLSALKRDKVCDYYLLGRGCVKGDECDYIHPKAPDGSSTSKLCDFFYQPRGLHERRRMQLPPYSSTATHGQVQRAAPARPITCTSSS